MPNRHHGDDDDRPRRRRRDRDDDDDEPRPRHRKGQPPVAVFVLVGVGALLVLVAGVTVLVLLVRGASRPGPLGLGGAGLVTNGSFEDGPTADIPGRGFITPVTPAQTAIPGWTVTRGSVDYIDSPLGGPPTVERSIDLNGIEPGGISQAIRTPAGGPATG